LLIPLYGVVPFAREKLFKARWTVSFMNKFISILVGLVFLLAPIYGWIVDYAGFGTAALTFLKGGLVWFLMMVGAVLLLSGLSGLKE